MWGSNLVGHCRKKSLVMRETYQARVVYRNNDIEYLISVTNTGQGIRKIYLYF
jgi:hypothetical protein